jgi:hypothetical protein
MNKTFLLLGVVVLILGVGAYVDSSDTHILLTGTHHTIPLLGLGVAVLGALIMVGGVLTGKPAGAAAAGQFKCAQCGAVFGSQAALDQHTRDKHGAKTKS